MSKSGKVAIVTGGLRGLGRAMAFGLSGAGYRVVAVGHIAEDVAEMWDAARDAGITADAIHPWVADIRAAAACDALVETTISRYGAVDILVNNAGLTFTTIAPDRFRRERLQRFYECGDTLVQAVMDTNFVAADRMARRVAPLMVERGWGRIINVTTKLDTMNRAGSSPYGPSKAALENATEIWAKDLADTGVTVNVVNPGAGANTPGMAQEMRDASREGRAARLLEPEEMVAPLLYVVSAEADLVNGFRFDANIWDRTLPPSDAARKCGRRAGLVLHEPGGPL
jgi:NAD(P)-dependent dehydrogenase (short-subunit alcohol dehydrogenase family)